MSQSFHSIHKLANLCHNTNTRLEFQLHYVWLSETATHLYTTMLIASSSKSAILDIHTDFVTCSRKSLASPNLNPSSILTIFLSVGNSWSLSSFQPFHSVETKSYDGGQTTHPIARDWIPRGQIISATISRGSSKSFWRLVKIEGIRSWINLLMFENLLAVRPLLLTHMGRRIWRLRFLVANEYTFCRYRIRSHVSNSFPFHASLLT